MHLRASEPAVTAVTTGAGIDGVPVLAQAVAVAMDGGADLAPVQRDAVFGLALQVGPLYEPEGPELKIVADDDRPARIGAGLIPLRRFCCYH